MDLVIYYRRIRRGLTLLIYNRREFSWTSHYQLPDGPMLISPVSAGFALDTIKRFSFNRSLDTCRPVQ